MRRDEIVLRLAPLAVGAIAIAAWAFGRGVEDWRYQLAGLGDPFLGRPSAGSGVLVNVVLTAIVAATTMVGKWIGRRRDPAPVPTGRLVRRPLLWLIVAGWAGYAAGGAVMIAGGGSTETGGSMHIEFGMPLNTTADVPMTCRSVVGDPETVAEINPSADGFLRFVLRDVTTGQRWAAVDVFLTSDGIPGNEFEPRGVPERAAPRLLTSQADGSTTEVQSITFMQAYDHHVTRSVESGRSGIVELTGVRWNDPFDGPGYRWVDLVIPDDPWTESYSLTIVWTCERPTS